MNPAKMQLNVPKLIHIGTEITKDKLRPEPKKVETVTSMPNPENKQELQRLLVMVKYLSSFQITAPIRILLREAIAYLPVAALI